ncbi:hypothetical protein [Photorhabdus tasmaniensis]|uniref:Uncharacterized protein n=1 Tax=Photorhabdus tasmaniensis TaxID=1004159 RepID=A0ABX0GM59_9GAMM|nr:hypothetical protein [Photorhabdus tasmaniensis]NHB90333.1 hypothetical protein [Photorhabdus tasmaniensis]
MKFVNWGGRSKVVTYFGIEMSVPSWAKYIAADVDGDVYCYRNQPRNDNRWWDVQGDGSVYWLKICKVEFENDECWSDSLVRV